MELQIHEVDYGGILHQVNGCWQGGQVVGLLGPNGAGKSTLLRLLAGLRSPSSGRVTLNGQDLRVYSPRQRALHIAYLPQELPKDIPYTVTDFVEMGLYARRGLWGSLSTVHHRRVPKALQSLNLGRYKDTPMASLSGGERQRAGLARCLVQGSPIFLLDEPTANLDLYHQLDILNRLRTFANDGYLVVLAIHDLEMAARYCTTLVLLAKGRVQVQGEPVNVLTEQRVAEVFGVPVRRFEDPYGDFIRFSFSQSEPNLQASTVDCRQEEWV